MERREEKPLYFEDIEPHEPWEHGEYHLTKEEIIEFASKWDPQPFHIDEEKAKNSVFGGLAACSVHNFSIMSHLLFNRRGKMKVLAGLGTENKMLKPSRPGDRLHVRYYVIEKRESKSRPDAGIVKSKLQLINQNNEIIVDSLASALVAKRNMDTQ